MGVPSRLGVYQREENGLEVGLMCAVSGRGCSVRPVNAVEAEHADGMCDEICTYEIRTEAGCGKSGHSSVGCDAVCSHYRGVFTRSGAGPGCKVDV